MLAARKHNGRVTVFTSLALFSGLSKLITELPRSFLLHADSKSSLGIVIDHFISLFETWRQLA